MFLEDNKTFKISGTKVMNKDRNDCNKTLNRNKKSARF